MQITINSQALAAELRLLNKVVPSKPALAILAYASLTATDGQLTCYATDLELSLTTTCPVVVGSPGRIILPAAKFLALVEQFPNADVSIDSQDGSIVVRCGAFASRLQTMQAEDHPRQPEVKGTSSGVEAAALRLLIARTRYAISATTGKHVLQGALLLMAGDKAGMVATDGKRLAVAAVVRHAGENQRLIVPAKALDVLANDAGDGDVTVTVGASHLFFSSDGKVLTSRKMDGEFPSYERIVPQGNDKVATVERTSLTAALRRTVLVSEENKAVYLVVKPGTTGQSGLLELTSASIGMGSAAEPVQAAYDGEQLEVCINGGYVLDFLNAASEPTVKLSFKDANNSMMLDDGEGHKAVIMPMRGAKIK